MQDIELEADSHLGAGACGVDARLQGQGREQGCRAFRVKSFWLLMCILNFRIEGLDPEGVEALKVGASLGARGSDICTNTILQLQCRERRFSGRRVQRLLIALLPLAFDSAF